MQALAEIAAGMKIGSGFDAASQLGPVVSKRHFERVMQHIEAARQAGARIVTGVSRRWAVATSSAPRC